ncbi:MAG: CapA family protein [Myxococcota bacterium]
MGDQYDTAPLPEYPALAERLTDAGVDVLLGHHPHVLQPVRVRTTSDGRSAVVAFSLGNFVSNMAERYDPASEAADRGQTRDGLVLQVTLQVDGDGTRRVLTPTAVPLWTDNVPDRIRVRTLESLRASSDPTLVRLAEARRSNVRSIVGAVLAEESEDTD